MNIMKAVDHEESQYNIINDAPGHEVLDISHYEYWPPPLWECYGPWGPSNSNNGLHTLDMKAEPNFLLASPLGI